MEKLRKYSDPTVVKTKAKAMGLEPSTRKDKKYMTVVNGKTIHFGAMGMEDYTKHKDKARMERFKKRNGKWRNALRDTARYMAYHLLW